MSSSLLLKEKHDPIIRSTHPKVSNLLTQLQSSGSEWDNQNTSLLYNRVPHWIREEDENDNKNVKYLFQIMSSYFDSIYCQIKALPEIKQKRYVSSSFKAIPFADRLLEERGLVTYGLFGESTLFEKFRDRDVNKIFYEKEISEVMIIINFLL